MNSVSISFFSCNMQTIGSSSVSVVLFVAFGLANLASPRRRISDPLSHVRSPGRLPPSIFGSCYGPVHRTGGGEDVENSSDYDGEFDWLHYFCLFHLSGRHVRFQVAAYVKLNSKFQFLLFTGVST